MMKVYNESGKGYWMEGFGTFRADGESRPTRPGHVIVLNDQGDGIDSVYAIDQQGGKSNCGFAKDVMVTLCADSHGTPHAVCYQLIVLNDQGGAVLSVSEIPGTLRAQEHGHQAVACFEPGIVTRLGGWKVHE